MILILVHFIRNPEISNWWM